MKTVKILSCLVVISLLATLICSCVKTPLDKKVIVEFNDLTVLEVDFNSDAGNHAEEYPLWSSEKALDHVDASAPEKYTVKFNGTKYTGDYQDSYVAYGESCISHEYEGDNVEFSINSDTGELTSFRYRKNPYSQDNTLDETDCRKIADEFAGKYINVHDYAITVDVSTESSWYQYDRLIGHQETLEYLAIKVDKSGNIISFNSRMLNSFNNVVDVVYDEEKVIDAVESKIKEIYKDVDSYEGYEISRYHITKLKDGSYGLLYSVSATVQRIDLGDGTYAVMSTPITLLITGSTTKPAN